MCCVAFVFFVMLLGFGFFFFFQAEDGIRDRDVTGVQTCALPISSALASLDLSNGRDAEYRVALALAKADVVPLAAGLADDLASRFTQDTTVQFVYRSEERRVGKDCRRPVIH